jgi:uncharacterized protein (TIGR01777 family)
MSGSTGLVGAALVPALAAAGHAVTRMVRPATGARAGDSVTWDPGAGTLDSGRLAGHEAVIHLAGENIAAGRWTAARKERIRASRVAGTRLLATALAKLPTPPAVLISASAIGYYGHRGAEVLTETSAPGADFLARVCQDWEAAAEPARERRIRVVHLRFGVILSRTGGALARMLTPFRLGLGGRLGSGRQWMSWIALDDVVAVIRMALADSTLSGPVNVVAPQAVTNREFTLALGRCLSRPTLFPVPAMALRLLLGEMADALLLASTRVEPAVLAARGHTFHAAKIDDALAQALAKSPRHP